MKLNASPDRRLIRAAASSTRYVLVSFTAPDVPQGRPRTPVNVAFALDRSGSMSGPKVALAREAVVLALGMLRAEDRFSVVTFDDRVDLLVPATGAHAGAVRSAIRKVEDIEAGGSTDLAGGWLRGCEQIAEHLASDQIGRCLLLSDGHANRGITDRDELATHARQLRERGVGTSTFGIGGDFDERLLQGMAEAGGGNSYFVESAVQIPDLLTSELGEALEVVACEAVIRVRADRDVAVGTLNRFEVQPEADGATAIALRSVVARQRVAVVLRLTFPRGDEGGSVGLQISLGDAGGALAAEPVEVRFTFASHAENDAQRREVEVDREVARLYAAQARHEAVERNRAGDYAGARKVLERVARRIRQYAGADPDLMAQVGELEAEEVRVEEALSPMDMKSALYAAHQARHMRLPTGKARR